MESNINKHQNGLIDRNRRTLVKFGFSTAASLIALRNTNLFATETLTYPSLDEIVPAEWSGFGECIFTSQSVAGPYFFDDAEMRRDIRDGQDGDDLLLKFEVVNVARCIPLPEAIVQIWHCNSGGWYSGVPQGDPDTLPTIFGPVAPQSTERFHRGAQESDAQGKCEFLTKYPGWYAGRTVHIHAKVHLGGSHLITSQLYFPQELNDHIHAQGAYKGRGLSPYRNAGDSTIASSAGAGGSWPAIKKERGVYVANLRIGVLRI